MVKKQDPQQDVSSSPMAAEGGTDTLKKRDPQDEELRLRERLKRRKENRHRSQSQEKNRRGDGPRPNGLPARDSYGRGPPPGRNWRGGPPGPPRDWRGPPPPRGWRGPPPHGRRGDPWPRHHGRSFSRSRSRGRSRSRSRSSSRSSRSYSSDEDSRSRSRSVDSRSSLALTPCLRPVRQVHRIIKKIPRPMLLPRISVQSLSLSLSCELMNAIFVDYFRRKIGVKVNDVAMLRDKRTGRHKGFCYVELARLEDVIKAVSMNNQAPDFQRFPILIKASEAEKNYIVPSAGNASLIGQRLRVERSVRMARFRKHKRRMLVISILVSLKSTSIPCSHPLALLTKSCFRPILLQVFPRAFAFSPIGTPKTRIWLFKPCRDRLLQDDH